jgi:hypothetical protein
MVFTASEYWQKETKNYAKGQSLKAATAGIPERFGTPF